MSKLKWLWVGVTGILLVAAVIIYILNFQMYQVAEWYLPFTGFLKFSRILYKPELLASMYPTWEFAASPVLSYVYLYCTEQSAWQPWIIFAQSITVFLAEMATLGCAIMLITTYLDYCVEDWEDEDDIFQPIRRYR